MSKKITVRTGNIEEAAKEFIDIWHQIENGHAPSAAIEKINFKDQRLLFKTLTPKRLDPSTFPKTGDFIREQVCSPLNYVPRRFARVSYTRFRPSDESDEHDPGG